MAKVNVPHIVVFPLRHLRDQMIQPKQKKNTGPKTNDRR